VEDAIFERKDGDEGSIGGGIRRAGKSIAEERKAIQLLA
jgi:hypothetical protein